MANVSVAAEWQLLYNRYYRKPELYPMRWKHVDLARNKIAAAPFGGPLAVIRDDSKIVQLHGESALRKLRIFSSSGHLLADTVWRNPGGRLIGMSWTDDHTLVCVVQDGTVYRYDVHARLIEPNLSLGNNLFIYYFENLGNVLGIEGLFVMDYKKKSDYDTRSFRDEFLEIFIKSISCFVLIVYQNENHFFFTKISY